jgi:hypothetical protein
MTLKEQLSSVFSIFREGATLRVIVEAIQDEFVKLASDTEAVEDSISIESATGQSLDLIADEFGAIGQRRGRSDREFRQFLQGLEPAFGGRGTERDVSVAVAAGVTFDPSVVELVQDFQAREYQVVLLNSGWVSHSTATTRTLADLADPVAVDRIDPVILLSDPADIGIQFGETDPGLFAIGLSSDELAALSTQGNPLSTRNKLPAEVVGYDLQTTGAAIELQSTPNKTTYSFSIQATAAVAYVVEIRGDAGTYSQVGFVDGEPPVSEGFEAPEAVDVRIRNITTAPARADVVLGAS